MNTQWTRSRNATTGTADVSPRLAVSTDSSNVGVRGGLQLTPWARGEFQCETQANIDGLALASLCNRNSRLGLATPAGTFWYGNWDTPFKAGAYGTKADDPFGSTDVFAFQSIMGSPGFNYRSSGWKTAPADVIHGFDVRANNSIGYWTPKYFGLTGRFQYSTNELKTADATISPKLWSGSLLYDRGPFSMFGSAEVHEDAFGLANINAGAAGALPATATFGATAGNTAVAHSEDWAWRVGAGYELTTGFGATTLMAAVEELRLQQFRAPVGAVREYKRWAWQAGLRQRVGNHELRARYSMADDGDCELVGGAACSTADFGASMYALGYAYHLAKTTQAYLHWSHILNDRRAQYTFGIGGAPAVTGTPGVRGTTLPGQDPEALALGLRHTF